MESSNKRRKKSRWGGDDKVVIPGLPTNLPVNLSSEQERIYLLQLQIEDLTRRLRTGDLEIPTNPEERSPSPEPIYNNEGKRLNTREFRTRKKLEDERHNLIQEMVLINPSFKPPSDYKPPQQKISEKVLIPQEEYPEINFVGLLIGPRGNTLKGMEKDSGAKIIIRGKGSVKEGKIGRKDGQPMPGEDEPLHAFVTASTHESVLKAVQKIKDVIRQGIEVPENQNDLRKNQLRELALLNGTLRETDGPKCFNCGSSAHRSWQCPDKPNVTNNVICSNCGAKGHISKDCKEKKLPQNANSSKIDEEYLSLMAELGEGPRPPKMNHSSGGVGGNSSLGGSGPNFSGPGGPPRAITAGTGPRDSHGPSQSQSHHPGNPHHSNVQQNGSWSRNDNQSVVQPPYWQSTQNQTAYGYGSSAGVSPSTAYPQMPAVDSYSYMYSQAQTANSNPWLQQGWSQNANMTVVPSPPPPPPPPDGQRTPTTPTNSTSWMGYMNMAGVSSIGLNAPPPPPPPPSVPTIPAGLYVAPPPPPPPPPPPS